MNVAELFALIGIKFDDDSEKSFDNALDGFANKLGQWADKSAQFMTKAFAAFFLQDLYNVAKEGVGRVASLLDPSKVFEDVAAQANTLDSLAKQARALNVSTEALQRYRFIAGQNGIDQKKFEQAQIRVNKTIGEATRGTKSHQKVISDLGLNYRDLAKMTGEQRFDKMLESLAGITDESKRTALGIRLLGDRTFPQFATLLKGGAEGLRKLKAQADELGFIVSDKDAQKAETFNDALDRTTRVASSLKNDALNPLFDPLSRLLLAIQVFIVENKELLSLPFRAFGMLFTFVFSSMASGVEFVSDKFRQWVPVLQKWSKRVGGLVGLLKLATALTIGFGVAWAWVNSTLVIAYFQRLAIELIAVIVRLVLAAESAFLFLKNLSAASVWAAIRAGFSRLIVLLSTTTAQFIILALFIAGVLLLLEDVYTLFDGGDSIIGDIFGLDPDNEQHMKEYYNTLLLVGVALGIILALLTGIPGIIAIILVAGAYVAANWDSIMEGLDEVIEANLDTLSDLILVFLQLPGKVGDAIKNIFTTILDSVTLIINALLDEIGKIPGKARTMIASLPGASLLGLSGGDVVGGAFGGGAGGPGTDQAGRVFQARNNSATNISPTITVKVDATDKTPTEAASIFKGDVFKALFREIDNAYDGAEE